MKTFLFSVAVCFVIIIAALPFYLLGAGVVTALRLSALWLLAAIPFGCAVGTYLKWRNSRASY